MPDPTKAEAIITPPHPDPDVTPDPDEDADPKAENEGDIAPITDNDRLATIADGEITPLTKGQTVKALARRLFGIFAPVAASDRVLAKSMVTIIRELVYTHGVDPAALPDRIDEYCDQIKTAAVVYGSLMATPDAVGIEYDGYTPPAKADGTRRTTVHPAEIAEALVGGQSMLRRVIGKG